MAAPTSTEALLLCFNQTHPSAPDTNLTEVTFGTPAVTTPAEQTQHNRNTKVTVTASASAPFQGSGEYFYNRLNFSVLDLSDIQDLLDNAQNKKVSDIVAAINLQNDTGIAASDVANWNDDITEASLLAGFTLTLTATATSHAWQGSAQVVLASMKPKLTDIFTSNVLNGITVTQVTE